MAETKLRIPDQQIEVFAELLSTPSSDLEVMAEAIEGTELPSLSEAEFATRVAKKIGADESKVLRAVRVLTMLHVVARAFDIAREDVIPSVISAVRKEEKLDTDDDQVKALEAFFDRVLFLDKPTRLLAKGSYLLAGHACTYGNARVITDLRPIFGAELGAPLAAIIQHSLEIHVHKGAKGEDLYVVLDGQQVEKLIEVLKRAKVKEAQLLQWTSDVELPLLRPTEVNSDS